MLGGIPGSGKTTYVTQLLSTLKNVKMICPDDIRYELTGDMSNQSQNSYIFNTVVPARIKAAIDDKSEVIIYDATNYDNRSRNSILKLFEGSGYLTEFHYFAPDLELSKERNSARSRVVPDFVLEKMARNWQYPDVGMFDKVIKLN